MKGLFLITIVGLANGDILLSQDFKFSASQMLEIVLNNTTNLSKVLDHGCWCTSLDINSKSPSGGTTITDELDSICRDWAMSRSCNENFFGGECTAFKDELVVTGPVYIIPNNNVNCSLNVFDNVFGNCLFSSCEIDLEYASMIKNVIDSVELVNTVNTETCDTPFGDSSPNNKLRICDNLKITTLNDIDIQLNARNITISNQNGQTNCQEGSNFVVLNNTILVSGNCNATFIINDIPTQEFDIQCSSHGYQYFECEHPNQPSKMKNLYVHKRLSSSTCDQTTPRAAGLFGIIDDGARMYVDNGCRADFRYSLDNEITCGSQVGEVVVCDISMYGG